MELRTCEIDAQLLEQFSALGTTDKDELVNQLKAIIGSEITSESSRFFLELAGWNLQRAIGAYFDFSFENSPSVGSPQLTCVLDQNSSSAMEVVQLAEPDRLFDVRILPASNDVSNLPKSFRVRIENCGPGTWPDGSYLRSESDPSIAPLASQHSGSGKLLWLPIGTDGRIPILPVHPGQSVDLTVDVIPPDASAFGLAVVGAFTFCLPNDDRFGETLYCSAVPDLISGSWRFQRGVYEDNNRMEEF